MSDSIVIYTDGACRGNPGPGGWGVVLQRGDHQKELFGGEPDTTNNRMELMAAIESLKALKRGCKVRLYTDSQYVKNGVEKWMANWKQKNWMTAARKPVKNRDLWEILDSEVNKHNIQWYWVKGHSGDPGNEQADQLANRAIDALLATTK